MTASAVVGRGRYQRRGGAGDCGARHAERGGQRGYGEKDQQ